MFYNYIKLLMTKELINYSTVNCIIICQNIFDFSTVEMLFAKGVKKIINCVDYIYCTECLELISKNGIEILYLKAKYFDEFESFGIINISNKSVYYNKIFFALSTPDNMSIDSLVKDFASNTIDYIVREKELIYNIEISGRSYNIKPVSIVISRGQYGKADIKYIKKIIKKEDPSIICVDGGGDIALKYHILPDMIIGDMDSISQNTIRACDNYIIHTYLNGICPGMKNIPENKRIGFIKCFGTSEDAAILYSIKKGSTKIYTLGFHINTLEYIEKGRKGMASSLLIRLYYGHMIVDIKNLYSVNNKIPYLLSSAALILIILYFSFFTQLSIKVFK